MKLFAELSQRFAHISQLAAMSQFRKVEVLDGLGAGKTIYIIYVTETKGVLHRCHSATAINGRFSKIAIDIIENFTTPQIALLLVHLLAIA